MRKEENLFKRYLKRKIRITSAFVVGFLISGSIAMAASTDSTNGLSYDSNNKITHVNNSIDKGQSGLIIGENNQCPEGDFPIIDEQGNGIVSISKNTSTSLQKFYNNGIILGSQKFSSAKNIAGINIDNTANGISIRANEVIDISGVSENKGQIKGQIVTPNNIFVERLADTANGIILGDANHNTRVNFIINNNGNIQANAENLLATYMSNSLNGLAILGKDGNVKDSVQITNSGIISSNINFRNNSVKEMENSANAIVSPYSTIGLISNSGVIRANTNQTIEDTDDNSSGHGIFANELSKLDNSGVIMAKNTAVHLNTSQLNQNFVNNGVMAGNRISSLKNGASIIKDNNGIFLSAKNNNTISIGKGGQVGDKTILNGSTTGVANASNGQTIDVGSGEKITDVNIKTENIKNQNKNVIINGTGIKKAALYVDSKFDLTNSVVNAYGTAIEVSGNNQLALGDTTVNGGGLDGNIDLIKGDDKDNTVDIYGSSIINGNINLGKGNDTLTIGNSVQLNGMLNDNEGNDTLNLGKAANAKESSNLIVYNNISGFENINTNGNVTLTATSKVTGASNINLQSGNLYLQFNGDNGNKITDHALSGNKGTITSNGGNLVFGVGNLANGTTIAMGETKIDPNLIKNNHLLTNSGIVSATVDKNNNVVVGFAPDIPVEPPVSGGDKPTPPVPPSEGDKPTKPVISINSVLYGKLNAVYHSMVSAGLTLNDLGITPGVNNGLPSKDPNEMNKILTLANQIYANTPYAYTLKSSRDSLKLFEDNMDYLTVKPLKGQSIVQGKAIYTGVRNDSSYSGNDYYGADKGSVNYKTTTNTVGGIATYEYGLDDNTSIGLALGGNHQKVDFKGASDISANSAYIGAFAKKEINNFKLKTGVGYQYTSAKGERNITNGYQNFSNNDKYDINGLNAFAEVKYSIKAGDNWLFEPKAKVSYYYLSQEEVKENNSPNSFALKVDKSNSNTADVEVGADFVKEIALEKAKVKNIVSVGVINTLGENDKSLKANIIGTQEGSQFEIAGAKLPRTSGKVSYNLEVEAQNGMIYSAGVSMEFAKDYNRNINTTLGIGYKF